MAHKSHCAVVTGTQSDERSQTTSAARGAMESPTTLSCANGSNCELLIEQQQCVPPSSEHKRLVEILFIKKKLRAVTYRNDA